MFADFTLIPLLKRLKGSKGHGTKVNMIWSSNCGFDKLSQKRVHVMREETRGFHGNFDGEKNFWKAQLIQKHVLTAGALAWARSHVTCHSAEELLFGPVLIRNNLSKCSQTTRGKGVCIIYSVVSTNMLWKWQFLPYRGCFLNSTIAFQICRACQHY